MRKILAYFLRLMSSAILNKYQPKIVAVTGSVGKTSTKEAIWQVLKSKYLVRVSSGNYNTEIGVPLTIIGTESGGRDVFKWLGIFLKALGLIFNTSKYPEVLILEMGADKPGDLEYLTLFIKPDISVVTAAGISHFEKFGSREAVIYEKSAIVRNLKKDGVAILNLDNPGSASMRSLASDKVLTYGLQSSADFYADNIRLEEDKELNLLMTVFSLHSKFGENTVILEKALGEPMVYSSLAAVACAYTLGLTLKESSNALRAFQSAPGRLNLVAGVNGSRILDDTYNAAPDSMVAAIKLLKEIPGTGRKIAILGRMAELGSETEAGHREVGKIVAKLKPDLLWVKDNEASMISDEAVASGFPAENVKKFKDLNEIDTMLHSGDIILIKASRSEKFEKIVEKIALKD